MHLGVKREPVEPKFCLQHGFHVAFLLYFCLVFCLVLCFWFDLFGWVCLYMFSCLSVCLFVSAHLYMLHFFASQLVLQLCHCSTVGFQEFRRSFMVGLRWLLEVSSEGN